MRADDRTIMNDYAVWMWQTKAGADFDLPRDIKSKKWKQEAEVAAYHGQSTGLNKSFP